MKGNEIKTKDEDSQYVSLYKKGDMDAFEKLVMKHQKKMLNLSYRILGSYEDACETVQDAFVSAYKNIKQFDERAKFSTWLCAIVINHSRNRLKQIKTRLNKERFSVDDPVVADEDNIKNEPASNQPSALEMLERKEIQQKVQTCINSLDIEFREVIVLRDLQGFSYSEISDMLKIAEGTVKSRLFRARDAVKACLQKITGEL